MPANICIPYYRPGQDVTGHAAAALTGKRFCEVDANRQAGGPAGISDTALGGNIVINTPAAGGKVFGVVSHDVASGGKVAVIRGSGQIVPVTCAANIAANEEVQVDSAGRVVPYDPPALSGNAEDLPDGPHKVGLCVTAATNGNDAQIALY